MLAVVLRLAIMLAAAALAGCSKSNVSTAPSASVSAPAASPPFAPSSESPQWLTFAERAPMYGAEARKARTGPSRKPPRLAEIDALFDRMTKEPETASGLRSAATMLDGSRPLASDPKWAGSGTSPGALLLHHGGMALLVDLAQRACAASPGDGEIGKAADTIPLPPIFNSGGRDANAAERDRHVLQEAARACGSRPAP